MSSSPCASCHCAILVSGCVDGCVLSRFVGNYAITYDAGVHVLSLVICYTVLPIHATMMMWFALPIKQ
jgi:cytochrome b subunit of formate dehydrogenase